MIKRIVFGISIVLMFATAVFGQNTNSSNSKRPRTTTAGKPAAETQKTTNATNPAAEPQKTTDTPQAKTATPHFVTL